jgi:hypothetical protein
MPGEGDLGFDSEDSISIVGIADGGRLEKRGFRLPSASCEGRHRRGRQLICGMHDWEMIALMRTRREDINVGNGQLKHA